MILNTEWVDRELIRDHFSWGIEKLLKINNELIAYIMWLDVIIQETDLLVVMKVLIMRNLCLQLKYFTVNMSSFMEKKAKDKLINEYCILCWPHKLRFFERPSWAIVTNNGFPSQSLWCVVKNCYLHKFLSTFPLVDCTIPLTTANS